MSGAILTKRGRRIALAVLGGLALGALALGIAGVRNALGASFGWGITQIVVAAILLVILAIVALVVNEAA